MLFVPYKQKQLNVSTGPSCRLFLSKYNCLCAPGVLAEMGGRMRELRNESRKLSRVRNNRFLTSLSYLQSLCLQYNLNGTLRMLGTMTIKVLEPVIVFEIVHGGGRYFLLSASESCMIAIALWNKMTTGISRLRKVPLQRAHLRHPKDLRDTKRLRTDRAQIPGIPARLCSYRFLALCVQLQFCPDPICSDDLV